jgi:predicted dehydrogenase
VTGARVLGIGILGAGGIGERAMVEPSASIEGVEVVCIGSRDPERARAWAARNGIRDSGDYQAVFAHPDVDLVYVALPPTEHVRWATRALEAGKHVLCEKPLSANGAGARAIADAAVRTGRRAFAGFHYRLHGFILELLDVLDSGELGAVEAVEIDYSIPSFVVKPGNIRLDGDLGGGAVMDVGCYAIDLVRAAWGEPRVVEAAAVTSQDDPRIDLQTDAVLELPGGAPVRMRASFLGQDRGAMTFRVHGAAAVLETTNVIVPQWGARYVVTAPDGRVLRKGAAAEGEISYVRQLEHLAVVLADGGDSPLEAEKSVGTMRVVDDVYRAAGLQPR